MFFPPVLAEIKKGEKLLDREEVFRELRKQYGEKKNN